MAGYPAALYLHSARLIAIYLAALAVVRLMGKRALGQLSLFDLVVMVGIGDVIVVVGLERSVPVLDGLLVLGILGGLELVISYLTFHWPWAVRIFEGRPTVLMREGKLNRRGMAREHISRRDLAQELRKQGVDDPAKVKEAVYEACGQVSVITEDENAEDMARILAELGELRRELAELTAKIERR